MNWKPIPQGPWYNSKLKEGAYDAVIKNVQEGVYGKQRDKYLQVVLRQGILQRLGKEGRDRYRPSFTSPFYTEWVER